MLRHYTTRLGLSLLTLLLLPKLFERFGDVARFPAGVLMRLLPWRKS